MKEKKLYYADNSILDDLNAIHKFKSYSDSTVQMIAENFIWFASLDSLNDPFEGAVIFTNNISLESVLCAEHIICNDETNIDYTNLQFANHINSYKKNPKLFLETKRSEHIALYKQRVLSRAEGDGFFCALSEPNTKTICDEDQQNQENQQTLTIRKNHEEISLWSHYGNGLRGIRITYDPLIFKRIGDVSSSLIKYQDHPETIDATHEARKRKAYHKEIWDEHESQRSFTTKASSWSYEREIRIRCRTQGKVTIPMNGIVSISFGSKMPPYQRSAVVNAAKQNNPNIRFYLAKISDSSFKIEYEDYSEPPHFDPKAPVLM